MYNHQHIVLVSTPPNKESSLGKGSSRSSVSLLSENNHYHVAWINRNNDDEQAFEHIKLKVSHVNGESQSLLFSMSVYLTTGVIMCQGTAWHIRSDKEFPILKKNVFNNLPNRRHSSDDKQLPKPTKRITLYSWSNKKQREQNHCKHSQLQKNMISRIP